jgi:protein-tyrosine phosphatase
MIDLHTHVLPALDDGPRDLEGSLELARVAVAAGTHVMAATPHIEHGLAVDPATVPARVDQLRADLDAAGVPLDVRRGGEVGLSRCPELDDGELAAIAIGDRWILLECPLQPGASLSLSAATFDLQSRGFDVLLAHPERCPDLQRDRRRLGELVARGARCQVTAGALTGEYGGPPRALALSLLEEGLVHVLASDAHDARARPPDLRPGLAAAASRLSGFADGIDSWLTEEAPGAIAAGEPVFERAPGAVRRTLRARLGR